MRVLTILKERKMSLRSRSKPVLKGNQNNKISATNKCGRNIKKENVPILIQGEDSGKNIKGKSIKVIGNGVKRKAELEVITGQMVTRKRSAFGDITNAIGKNIKNDKASSVLKPSLLNTKTHAVQSKENVPKCNSNLGEIKESEELSIEQFEDTFVTLSGESLNLDLNKRTPNDVSSYVTPSEGSPARSDSTVHEESITLLVTTKLPLDVEDFDKASSSDLYSVSEYAMDIFKYYKERESKFEVQKYISKQPDVNRTMRIILVDWMVEVQETFELNHETLYLAVKLVDLYLSKVMIKRDQLQLIGSTAIFIACKFDERSPPYVDDFLYICDDAYKKKELIGLEIKMLKVIGYDLGIPLSYRFLRRYARCAKVNMENLTFARYFLELSLMEYDLIEIQGSLLAAACLFLALHVKQNVNEWSPTLVYYSGYKLQDFYHVVHLLHQMLHHPPKEKVNTIKSKYSHKAFFEVSKIPIPEYLDILENSSHPV